VAYFQSQGVNPNLLSAKGFGEANPVAPNDTPEGRARNRRIAIVLNGDGT
jgi:outer membrane protein OmpA-like peptidoglycan-associated protein